LPAEASDRSLPACTLSREASEEVNPTTPPSRVDVAIRTIESESMSSACDVDSQCVRQRTSLFPFLGVYIATINAQVSQFLLHLPDPPSTRSMPLIVVNARAKRDLEGYRKFYPEFKVGSGMSASNFFSCFTLKTNSRLNDNVNFYLNRLPCRPDNLLIDDLLAYE
jgi:hypothetical protein